MTSRIGAVVLAAGRSQRMGEPKLVLPWGARTVIAQVAGTLLEAGIGDVVVVTGGWREAVEKALSGMPVLLAHNPDYEQSEMLTSLQVGLRALSALEPPVEAALVVLGDQPTIEGGVIKAVMEQYAQSGAGLLVPSYQRRRGHPWMVRRDLWPGLFAMTPDQTMRDFLNAHEITYVNVDSPGILKDLDTPEDYREQRPGGE